MRIVRPILLATVLFAAPIGVSFAQSAPTKAAAAPPAKASAAPSTKASAAPTAVASASAPSAHDIQTDVDTAMSDKAQALFKEGNALFRSGKFAEAQASYKAAWALDLRSQRVVNNLGMTELELKLYRDAAEHLTIALRLADPNDPKRSKIQSNIDEARAKVAAIAFKINTDGAEIVHMETGRAYPAPFVDPIFVDPGKSSFRIRREGFESQEKVVDLKAGEATSVEITLDRGKAYGSGAPTSSATAPGAQPLEKRSRVPAFVLGGVGLAGLIAGGALVGVAAGKGPELRDSTPKDANGKPLCGRVAAANENADCAGIRSSAASASTMGNVGVGVLAAGGVLVAAGVVYLLLPPAKAPANSGSTIVPVASSEGGGLLWIGSF